MKYLPFFIKLFTTLRPLIKEAIQAVKAIQILKRQMQGDGNSTRLDFDLQKFFGSAMKAQEAILAFAFTVKKVAPAIYADYQDAPATALVIAFLRSMKDMPKHERRALLRELARTLIISRNRGQSFNDADLDTALQIAYSKVKDEDA